MARVVRCTNNEVTLRRARLVLGWVTVCGRVYHHHHHHHHVRVAGEGRRVVAPPCPRSTARLQSSPVGRVESFRSWSSHLFQVGVATCGREVGWAIRWCWYTISACNQSTIGHLSIASSPGVAKQSPGFAVVLARTPPLKLSRVAGNTVISCTIWYDTRCYFNVRSKANVSQLNLPHGTDN